MTGQPADLCRALSALGRLGFTVHSTSTERLLLNACGLVVAWMPASADAVADVDELGLWLARERIAGSTGAGEA